MLIEKKAVILGNVMFGVFATVTSVTQNFGASVDYLFFSMMALENYIDNQLSNGTFVLISNVSKSNSVVWDATSWYHVLASMSTSDADLSGYINVTLVLSLDGSIIEQDVYQVHQNNFPDLYSKFSWIKQLGMLSHACVSSSKDKPVRYINFTGANAAYSISDNLMDEIGVELDIAKYGEQSAEVGTMIHLSEIKWLLITLFISLVVNMCCGLRAVCASCVCPFGVGVRGGGKGKGYMSVNVNSTESEYSTNTAQSEAVTDVEKLQD
jgi:hypothetical protein